MKKTIQFLVLLLLAIPAVGMGAQVVSKQAKQTKPVKYNFSETVYVPLPSTPLTKWKLGFQNFNEQGMAVTRYILESETTSNWSQILNIQFKCRAKLKGKSAEEEMQIESAKSSFVNHTFHSKNPNDILYEREFPTGEHELVRMILTEQGLHRVAYVKRGPFSQADRALWIERLSQATIGGK